MNQDIFENEILSQIFKYNKVRPEQFCANVGTALQSFSYNQKIKPSEYM